jgi:hypothetical protein
MPKAAYRGAPSSTAALPSPEAKHLFDDERLPEAPSKAGRKRPQVEIHTQGRPPSVETERLEQKPPKVCFYLTTCLACLTYRFFIARS